MDENIQLVDIAQIGDYFDAELLKDEIRKKFAKVVKVQPQAKLKVCFRKHHDNPLGNPKYGIKVTFVTSRKTFMADKIGYSVLDVVTDAMDSAEKELRTYFEKLKDENISKSRLSVE